MASQDRDNSTSSHKEGTQHSDAALFLRKAYALVNSCPPELGGWSANGESFFVKDVDVFSNTVVPTFYKHNNWSSFVRQLNFYGFRKVKSDLSVNSPLVWEFMHPLFQRGKPHLLADIVKKTTGSHHAHNNRAGSSEEWSASSVQQATREVQDLRQHVVKLQAKMDDITASMAKLTTRVEQQEQMEFTDGFASAAGTKKRKGARTTTSSLMDGWQWDSDATHNEQREESNYASLIRLSSRDDSLFTGFDQSDNAVQDNGLQGLPAVDSGDLLDILCDLEGRQPELEATENKMESAAEQTEAAIAMPVLSSVAVGTGGAYAAPITTSDVTAILSSLSPALQERFVDRLAEVVGRQIVHDGPEEKTVSAPTSPGKREVRQPQPQEKQEQEREQPLGDDVYRNPSRAPVDGPSFRFPRVPCSCPSCNGNTAASSLQSAGPPANAVYPAAGNGNSGGTNMDISVSKAALYGYVLNVLSQQYNSVQSGGSGTSVF